METRTIENINFVQFMHQVVAAVEVGYTLDYEPRNAPESTPVYKVTLVASVKLDEELVQEPVQEIVENTIENAPEELEAPLENANISEVVENTTALEVAPKKPQGRPKK